VVYDPQNAKEEPALPEDTVFDGVIIDLKDGVSKDFVKNLDKWKGSPEQPCIEVGIEVLHNGKKYGFTQLFNYEVSEGQTTYSPHSNLGRFKNKYGELPNVGCQVKTMTDKDGFLRLKLD